MINNKFISGGILFSMVVASSIAVSQEQIQSSDQQSAESDENVVIIVSRQREENLQNVPITVSVFGEAEIEEQGIERAQDFISMTPNITMAESQNAGSSFITVRGLSQVRNGESPVAVAVDGVLQVSTNQFNQDLFDIAQIEILKGPQGALYGRNAIGGAINITTKRPSGDATGSLELDIGNAGYKGLSGGYSGELNEQLAFSLAASYSDRDGQIDNSTLNTPVDFQKDTNMRGRLIYSPNEELELDFRLFNGKTDGGALNFVFQPLFGINDADDASIEVEANNLGVNERKISQYSFKSDYQFKNSTMTFIASHDEVEEYVSGDQLPYSQFASANSPFGPYVFDGGQTQYLDISANSYELRFTSGSDQSLRWIAGAYVLQTDRFISSSTSFDENQGLLRIERTPFPSNAINPTQTFAADDNDNNAFALFSQFNYDVSELSEVSFSLRYDKDEREQTNRSFAPFTATPGEVRKAEFSKVQPKLSYIYKPNSNWSYFGSYAQGFRSGGFNQNGMGALAAGAGLDGVQDIYKAEEASNFEFGIKGSLSAHDTKLNLSLFSNKVEDQHYFVFVGALGAQVLTNIDEVNISGGEFEVSKIGEIFDLYFSVGVTDSEIRKFSLESTSVGKKAPYVADYTVNAGIQYNFEVNDWTGFIRTDIEKRGPQFWDHLNSSERSSLTLVNLRAGLVSLDNDWAVNLWAKNLSDEEYNSEWVLGGFGHRASNRTFGLEIRRNFE